MKGRQPLHTRRIAEEEINPVNRKMAANLTQDRATEPNPTKGVIVIGLYLLAMSAAYLAALAWLTLGSPPSQVSPVLRS